MDTPDITIVDWPRGEEERRLLAQLGLPRLLRVEPGHGPPVVDDPTEDWFRPPCSDEDIAARARAVRSRRDTAPSPAPTVDEADVLRAHGMRCPLAPVEARLMRLLLSRSGDVVDRDSIANAGWPDGVPSRNAVDLCIRRLRKRVEPAGMMIKTARGRGYLVEDAHA